MHVPFYAYGLRFTCTNCSNCCRHEPGYVFLTQADFDALASGVEMTPKDFFHTYCRIIDINGFKRISLKEKSNYDCIFWDGGCTLYENRPLQCRSYPFWSPFLESRDSWNSLERDCPGVNSGNLVSKKEIDDWLSKREDASFLTDRDVEKFI